MSTPFLIYKTTNKTIEVQMRVGDYELGAPVVLVPGQSLHVSWLKDVDGVETVEVTFDDEYDREVSDEPGVKRRVKVFAFEDGVTLVCNCGSTVFTHYEDGRDDSYECVNCGSPYSMPLATVQVLGPMVGE